MASPIGLILVFIVALIGTSMAMSLSLWFRKRRGRR